MLLKIIEPSKNNYLDGHFLELNLENPNSFRNYPDLKTIKTQSEIQKKITDYIINYSKKPYRDGAWLFKNMSIIDNWGLFFSTENNTTSLLNTGFGWKELHMKHLELKGFIKNFVKNRDVLEFNLNYDVKTNHKLTGTTCLLSFPGALTFGHWFFDVVGRIIFLDKKTRARIDNFLFPHPIYDWMLPFFEIMEIDLNEIYLLDKKTLFNCENLLIPTIPSDAIGGVPSFGIMKLLCNKFSSIFNKLIWLKHSQDIDIAVIKHTNQTSEANRVLKDIDRIVEYLRTSGMRVSIINPLNGTLANTLNQISRAQICIGQDSSALHNLFLYIETL